MINLLKKLVIHDKNFVIYILSVFVIMLSLFSFTLGDNSEQEVILTLIWICTTSVLQISTNGLFTSDYCDGILEQIFIQPLSSKFIIICKIFVHWLLFGFPISVISSIFNFEIFGNSIENSIAIGLFLLFSTFVIINISAVGNALTVGKNNLVPGVSQILILPITVPVFISFKLLVYFESLFLDIYTLFIVVLIFAILLVNSIIATYVALKFAIEFD
ncbi:MAG: heme exporter protein CcmB [Wolbachia endosymbiont of Menacanthus eurysternus]|nr:MAG: heme exporter protein CcmB [Wolbachia endosymbiont of Menacanthus eurysternus]